LPITAVRTLNSARVVYILQNNVATPVEITLGVTSDTNVQVASGNVNEGDLIVLNASTATTTTTQSSGFLGGLLGGIFGGGNVTGGVTGPSGGPGGGFQGGNLPSGGFQGGNPPSGGPPSGAGGSTGGN